MILDYDVILLKIYLRTLFEFDQACNIKSIMSAKLLMQSCTIIFLLVIDHRFIVFLVFIIALLKISCAKHFVY